MKKLSIEEKAKRYDEAIEKANSLWHYKNQPCLINVSEIFPELKESEDESIKKDLIDWVESFVDNVWRGHSKIDIIVWLKKQTDNRDIHLLELKAKAYDDAKERMSHAYNQNRVPIGFINEIFPNLNLYENQDNKTISKTNKVESKFKVGDWIIDKQGFTHQIENVIANVTNDTFGYYIVRGGYFNDNSDVRLWTIEDAKDGDVLVSVSNQPFIYNGKFTECTVGAYCGLNVYGVFVVEKYLKESSWTNNYNIRPATREQCDLLFAKIKENGYEWNVDKKILIKVTAMSKTQTSEYCYVLDYNTGKVFKHCITEDEVNLTTEELLKKYGLNEDECSIMYASNNLELELLED